MCILLFIPTDIWYINFSFQFMMIGCFLRKDRFSIHWFDKYKKVNIFITALYLVLVSFFSYDYSVYVAGTNFITNTPFNRQMGIVCYRFFIGVIGSIAISFLLHQFYKYYNLRAAKWVQVLLRKIEVIGENSLEMYCLQFIIVERLFTFMIETLYERLGISFTNNPYMCYFVWRHFFGIILVIIIDRLVRWIKQKNKKMSQFLF